MKTLFLLLFCFTIVCPEDGAARGNSVQARMGVHFTSPRIQEPPTITLTVNQEPVEDGATIVYKEGTSLELGCEVVGGVPDQVDGFIWMIHSEPLNYTPHFMDYRVDSTSIENGAEIFCKEEEEGTNRMMNCNAVNEEPHKIEKSEDKKVLHHYTLDIKDDKKLISCIANNQALGGAFYNSSFIPQKVGSNYE